MPSPMRRHKSAIFRAAMAGLVILLLSLGQASPASAVPLIYASSVQAGCYLARPNRCKIHVDPFTIQIAAGAKLVHFQLITIRSQGGVQKLVYDFSTDSSNPVPFSGVNYTPSLVAKDFGVSCGETYSLSLQGKDSSNANTFNLGTTSAFVCPTATFTLNLPVISH
jgi:hypothetical protein